MIKMSSKSSYGLRALLFLTRFSNQGPINLQKVSEDQKIPAAFLEQIFLSLKKAGIVKAVRGPHGGFELGRNPEDINLAQIIAVLEGPFEPVLCSFPEKKSDDCHDVDGCASRLLCSELDGALLGVLQSKTLASLTHSGARLDLDESPVTIHKENPRVTR